MFSSVIVQVALGLQLLFAAGNPSPIAVGQAAGQVSARSATDRAEARVSATSTALSEQITAKKTLQSRYDTQIREIDNLKKQRASWNRDRKIRKAKAAAQATGKKLAAANQSIARLKKLRVKQSRALVAATGKELASQPGDVRRAALITLRTRTASLLPSKRKARKIIIPNVDEFADPEELEEQAALLATAEKQLLREQRLLEQREKRFDKMAQLRDQRQRAGELDQFETNDVRRTTGRLDDPNKAADRGNNSAGGSAEPQNDGEGLGGDPAPPQDSGTGGNDNFEDGAGGFEQSSVVLADVVDSSTVSELRRAERSSNPKTKAIAAKRAREQVEARLAKLRALRKKMQERAKKLRK
jgi:hypothetical protein